MNEVYIGNDAREVIVTSYIEKVEQTHIRQEYITLKLHLTVYCTCI